MKAILTLRYAGISRLSKEIRFSLISKHLMHIWAFLDTTKHFIPPNRSFLRFPTYIFFPISWKSSYRFHLYVVILHQLPHWKFLEQKLLCQYACSLFCLRNPSELLQITASIAFSQGKNVNLESFLRCVAILCPDVEKRTAINIGYNVNAALQDLHEGFENEIPVIESINQCMYLSGHYRASLSVAPARSIMHNVGSSLIIRHRYDKIELTLLSGCVSERFIRNHYDSKRSHVHFDKVKSNVTCTFQMMNSLHLRLKLGITYGLVFWCDKLNG